MGNIKGNNIITFILSLALLFLFIILFILEIHNLGRIILPFLIILLISGTAFIIINHFCKDKYTAKIFMIAMLLHFIFLLSWQLIKYYILGFHTPTENKFYSYIIDNDGAVYHDLGVYLAKNITLDILQLKTYGGLFPKIIAFIYNYIEINPFIVSCFNSFISSLSAIVIYLIGKKALPNVQLAKIFAIISIFNFGHLTHTSVLVRDSYIVLFMYLSLYISYYFYKTKNILYLILTLLSLYMLFLFRPYAAFVMIGAIIASFIFCHLEIKFQNKKLKANKLGIVIMLLSPLIIAGIVFLFMKMTTFANILSVEDLIALRDKAYTGSNSDYSWDFFQLYNIFPLLPFIVGYICMFFAPFPWEWVLIRRMIYVPDMFILYSFLPSFFKNIKKSLIEKQYFPVIFFFSIIFMFTIYCITLGNSGTIHRNRAPFIPMIYLIAMSKPDKFLNRILNKIEQWRLV